MAHEQTLLLVPRIDGRYARFGVVATVETAGELPTGQNALVLRAHRRVLLGSGVAAPADTVPGVLWISTSEVDEGPITAATRALAQEYRVTVEAYVERQQGGRVTLQLSEIDDPSAMADTIAYWPELTLDRRVEALETIDVETRLRLALGWVLDADTTGLDDAKERIVEWLAVRKLRSERLLDERGSTELADSSEAAIESGQPSTEVPEGAAKKLLMARGEIFGTGPSSNTPRRGDGTTIILVGPPGVGKTSLGESVARAMGRRFVRVSLGGIRDEAEIRGHRRTYVGAKAGRIVEAMNEAGTLDPVILLDEIDKLATGWSGDPASSLLEVLDPAQNHTFRDHYLELDLDLSDVIFLATANSVDTIPPPLLDRMETISVDGYTDLEKMAIARNHLLPRQLELHGLRQGEVDVEFSDTTLRSVIEGYTREAGVRSFERQIAKVLRKAAFRIASEPGSVPNAAELGIAHDAFEGRRFHVHFPAGAVPKDGPSARITMTTVIVSLLTGRSVDPTLAMTGEVTLQGKVLPIGGVKQKLLAAHRAGLKTVIIPRRNDVDLDEVPEEIRRELTIHAIADVRDVVRLALVA